jgi:hypothetical protein
MRCIDTELKLGRNEQKPHHQPRSIREAGGKSAETMEAIANSKATLEAQLTSQRALLDSMRSDLGAAREHQALAESLAESRGRQLDELKVRREGRGPAPQNGRRAVAFVALGRWAAAAGESPARSPSHPAANPPAWPPTRPDPTRPAGPAVHAAGVPHRRRAPRV